MNSLRCRACGSTDLDHRGTKAGTFLRRDFDFHRCRACELMFVEPFSGFAIYDDAYYRGQGPDPYVDYETEYRDWRRTDRAHEFADLFRLAEKRLRAQATKGSKDQKPLAPRSPASPGPAAPDPLVLGPLALDPSSPAPSAPPTPASGSVPLLLDHLPLDTSTPAPLRWLDFGCGAGGFLKFLREKKSLAGRPLELTGHDVGSYATLLKSKDAFRILDLDEIRREPAASFDVISLIEVIEHLPEPLPPLELIARLLKPGGLLLLTTGNLDSPAARRSGIHYRYCAPEIHVSLFNPRTLARLYARVGLTPYPVRYDGAVRFKGLKTLRHRPALRAAARAALAFPPVVRAIDAVYGVSAMPCAVKPA